MSAADNGIGNVSTIYLKSVDSNAKEYETNISKGFQVNPFASYRQVDTAMRSLKTLSTNTYQDTILVTNVSVNDVMKQDEG